MNITNVEVNNDLRYITFNQDQSCFAYATSTGFRIFSCEPLKEVLKHDFDKAGVGFIEMLFHSNYIAIVGDNKGPLFPSNKVQIWEDKEKCVKIDLDFNYPVLGVRLRRDRIVVIMDKIIKVYTFTGNPAQLHVFETHSNPKGLCALCPSSISNAFLAFPWSKPGTVQLIDLGNTDKGFTNIEAHTSEIACMTLNRQGTRLATTSERGTLIRIFDTSTGTLCVEFRRGVQPAIIRCLNFNENSTRLCVSSDRGTIHIFALDDISLNQRSQISLLGSYFSSYWSFCKLPVPKYSLCICAFSANDDYLYAVCADGYYHKYSYNLDGTYNIEFTASFENSVEV